MNEEQLEARVKEIKKMGLNDIELFKGKMSISDLHKDIRDVLYKELDDRENILTVCGGAMVEMGDFVSESDNDRIEA